MEQTEECAACYHSKGSHPKMRDGTYGGCIATSVDGRWECQCLGFKRWRTAAEGTPH